MSREDELYIEKLVYDQLFALRFAAVAVLLLALVLLAATFGVISTALSTSVGLGAGEFVMAILSLGALGLALFTHRRGRAVKGSRLHRLMTTQSSSIHTMLFLNLTNRPFCHVVFGDASNRKTTIVCKSPAEQMLPFFTRVYPHARVVRLNDPRPTGPSSYA